MSMGVRLNNVMLTHDRMAQIRGAQTLGEAQRMGLVDRFVDWCRGGVKKAAIEKVFNTVNAPASAHGERLRRFQELHSFLRPEHMDQCQLNLQKDEEGKTWSYRMVIGGETLAQAASLPVESGRTLADFEDHVVLAEFGSHLHASHGADPARECTALCEKFRTINERQAGSLDRHPSSVMLEKFRLISGSLQELGVPANDVFPGVELSPDLENVELFVGRHTLARCPIPDRQVLTDALTTQAHACTTAVDHLLRTRDSDAAVIDTVDQMVDGDEAKEAMKKNLHDRFFCSDNFVGTRELEGDASRFEVTFRDAADVERSLVFSNRISTHSELRGPLLQGQLASGSYATLAELIARGFGSPQDAPITYLSGPYRAGFTQCMRTLQELGGAGQRLGFASQAAVDEYIQAATNAIAPMRLGNTSLEAVWGLKTTADGNAPRQAQQTHGADAAASPAAASLPTPRSDEWSPLLTGRA
ncbi:hypothetical protein [Comamonas endophytica]|nr:hypothetical protein [Acidovorax sp. D4N7]MCD2511934.1 hypothetical protein [Acidovorax sp. D4N7]